MKKKDQLLELRDVGTGGAGSAAAPPTFGALEQCSSVSFKIWSWSPQQWDQGSPPVCSPNFKLLTKPRYCEFLRHYNNNSLKFFFVVKATSLNHRMPKLYPKLSAQNLAITFMSVSGQVKCREGTVKGRKKNGVKMERKNGKNAASLLAPMPTRCVCNFRALCIKEKCLQCFDAVGLAAGRASGL